MFPNERQFPIQIPIITVNEIINIFTTAIITSVQTFQQPFAKRAPVAGTVATAHKPEGDENDDDYEN